MISAQHPPLVVIAHPNPAIADAIADALQASGAWRTHVAGPGRDALAAAVAADAQAAVVGCAALPDLPPATTVPVLAVGDPDRPADLHAATTAGAARLLPWPDGAADLPAALAELAGELPSVARGSVVAVAGVHGGAGTTSLAVHVAGAWARWGSGLVLLADLAGGLGFRLELHEATPTWASLAPLAERLDGATLSATLASPWPGLAVVPLAGLADGEVEPPPGPALVQAVVTAARSAYRVVVVDVPAGWPFGLAAAGRRFSGTPASARPAPDWVAGWPSIPVDVADVLLLVARPDSAGLTALESADEIRAEAGMPAARVGLVVIGAGDAAPVTSREVRARLGDRLWALIPSSPVELAAAAEDGLLLLDRPEIPAVQAMLALAHKILPFTGAAVVR